MESIFPARPLEWFCVKYCECICRNTIRSEIYTYSTTAVYTKKLLHFKMHSDTPMSSAQSSQSFWIWGCIFASGRCFFITKFFKKEKNFLTWLFVPPGSPCHSPVLFNPVFSTPATWSNVFQSCVFQSRVFSRPATVPSHRDSRDADTEATAVLGLIYTVTLWTCYGAL